MFCVILKVLLITFADSGSRALSQTKTGNSKSTMSGGYLLLHYYYLMLVILLSGRDKQTYNIGRTTRGNAELPFAKGWLRNNRGQANLCRKLNDPRRVLA